MSTTLPDLISFPVDMIKCAGTGNLKEGGFVAAQGSGLPSNLAGKRRQEELETPGHITSTLGSAY